MSVHRTEDLSDEGENRRVLRRGYLLGNAFEAWAGLAALLTGLVFIIEPSALENSAVAETAGALAIAWGILYTLGGLLMLSGLALPNAQLELAGLSLFGSSALIDGLALLISRGPAAFRVILIYLSVAAASAARAYLVLRLARIGFEHRPGR